MDTDSHFPPRTTFGCRALGGPSLGQAEPVKLSPFLAVHPHPPVDLDDTWTKWLGTIQADSFGRSKLVIVAQFTNPLVFASDALPRVQTLLQVLHNGLLLQGFGYCSGGLEVCGNTDYGLHIGPLGPVFPHAAAEPKALCP